ncbi:hypothetical protein K5I29_04355 [Flavobacterium agricola]|uniref:Cell division protein ZapB n=1 Tax=Flavobacterium agricola TaxID=2870839 RepID=A0ABY6M351_9FLAO|nr:protein bicaudal D homolog [Flavobacterium agricola]UYW02139.1 hypothetical protein K5I29_04355 [Flavobacterium agricola]
MEKQMQENDSNKKGYKVIIAILALLLIGSFGYMYKMSTDHTDTVTQIQSEKDLLNIELTESINKLDEAIAQNTSLSSELTAERDKLVALQKELQQSKSDVDSLKKYRNSYLALKKQTDKLLAENKQLREANQILTNERDSTMVELNSSKVIVNQLAEQTEILNSKVEEASKLVITNVSAHAYKQGGLFGGTNLKNTSKAKKADVLEIEFSVAANKLAKKGEKLYYVQIIDSNNNVIGANDPILFGEKYLTYSFPKEVNFQGQSVVIKHELPVTDLEKGFFFVNIFEQDELVGNSSFELK